MKTDTMIALFVLGALGYLIYQKAQGGTASASSSGVSSSSPNLLTSSGSAPSLQPIGVNIPSVGPIAFQPDFGLNSNATSSWD